MSWRVVTLTAALIACAPLAQAETYRWVDDDGTVHYSDEPHSGDGEAKQVNVPDVNTADSVDVERIQSQVDSSSDAGHPEVVMYSASWCHACDKARAYMNNNDIPFTEYGVEKSRKGKRDFAQMDVRGVPVILVGDQRVVGFSAQRFERMYDT